MKISEDVIKVLQNVNDKIISYPGANLVGDNIIDSFGVIEIVSALEDAFDIEIDAEYVVQENFANKDSIIALVQKIIKDK